MSLKKLLEERGISMYRLSKMSGVPNTVVVDLCSGKSAIENCTVKTVYAIAKALGCSVEELIAFDSKLNFRGGYGMNKTTVLQPVHYITGIHALNIPCSLDTSGDWHASALSWVNPSVKNTVDSVWGDYGIELSENVPENPGKHYVANHIRACLDLLADGRFTVAQTMKNDFICNDKYNLEIFTQVLKLKEFPHWDDVRNFMKREYRRDWLNFERRIVNG